MILSNLLEKKARSNAAFVTVLLLKKLNVPVTSSTVVDAIEHHPDYPSLYTISDSLSKWKVENIALKVDSEKLEEIPKPFIAYSKNKGGYFILVESVSNDVSYIDEKGNLKRKNKEDFKKEWSNIVLLANRNFESGEKDYSINKRKETINSLRIPFIVISCFLFIVFSASIVGNIIITTLLLLKLVGCIVSGLLLLFEVDKSNPIKQQICSAGRYTNCTAVLSSKQGKVFNFISWSEVGFFYFSGGYLFLLLAINQLLPAVALISYLNLVSLPYTVFSIFYQWRIAKQWCPLCLAIQAILLLEFIVCYLGFWNQSSNINLQTDELISLFATFFVPIFYWIATKNIYLFSQNGKLYKKQLMKIKYNKDVFNALLLKQRQVLISVDGLGITLGNPAASNTIIKVCNLYCGPCAKAHFVIDELLANNTDVKVQIIFTTTNNSKNIKSEPIKHLLALFEMGNEALFRQALNDWYLTDRKDYSVFASKYPLDNKPESYGQKLETMYDWCNEMGIAFTPTFFVNGYQLPEIYKVEELKYLL